MCETQEWHWFSVTSPNDLATVWSTLLLWADTMGQDWWVLWHTAVRWVVGALSGWIGHLWTGGEHRRGLVNGKRGRLRDPSVDHTRVPSGLIRKADEWCAWGGEVYKGGEEPLLYHPIACLPGIAPLNESRPRVNMPLGCQSIPVTCNTNTQNLLSYKINVLLVPPCIALAQSHWSPLKSCAAHVWQIIVKRSDGLGYTASHVWCLYDFKVIVLYQMSKYSKYWKLRHKYYWQTYQPNINIPHSRFGLQTNAVHVVSTDNDYQD